MMRSRLQGRLRSLMGKKKYGSRSSRPRRRAQRKTKMKVVRFQVRSKAQIMRESGLPLCGIRNCRIPECNIPRCGLLNCKLPECVLPEEDLAEYLLPNCGMHRCKLPQCHVQPPAMDVAPAPPASGFLSGDRKRKAGSSCSLSRRKSARLLAKKLRKSARLFEKCKRKRCCEELDDAERRRNRRKAAAAAAASAAAAAAAACLATRDVREGDVAAAQRDRMLDTGTTPSARGPGDGCTTSCKLCRRGNGGGLAEAAKGVVQRLTELGEENLLLLVLEKLPPGTLLQASRVCRSWARQCEIVFKRECQQNGWALPRHPRWSTTAFPWRSLYFRHACRVCGRIGEFFVRKRLNGNFQFLLCGTCIRLPSVKERLVQYSIDLYGVSGKLVPAAFLKMMRENGSLLSRTFPTISVVDLG